MAIGEAWKGETVVVSSTDLTAANAEERVIQSVAPSGSGSQVTVTAPFSKFHWGTVQTYTNQNGRSWGLDERAKVAMLDRNILIQGDDDSLNTGVGGVITIINSGNAWVRNVKLFRMGQKGALGQYPLHWHLLRSRTGNYMTGSVVQKSFNKCVVIHGTDNVLVERNICYDHIGHGFFLEDACETGNVFKYNLALLGKKPANTAAGSIDTDFTNQAEFWIVNPLNHYIGNVAAGSDFAGFWVLVGRSPINLCASLGWKSDMDPSRSSMGVFTDNVAHSADVGIGFTDGLCGGPRQPACSGMYYPNDIPVLNNFTMFKTDQGFRGVWVTMANTIYMTNSIFGDNSGMLFSGKQVVSDSLIVGESANTITDSTKPSRTGWGLYDGPAGLINSHFAGFPATYNSNPAAKFMVFAPVSAAYKAWNAFIQGCTFAPDIDEFNKWGYRGNTSQGDVFSTGLIDVDGGFTGIPDSVVVPMLGNDWRLTIPQDPDFQVTFPECSLRPMWGAYVCSGLKFANFRLYQPFMDDIAYVNLIKVTRSDGKSAGVDTGFAFRDWYQFNVITNKDFWYTITLWNDQALAWSGGRPRDFFLWISSAEPGASVGMTVENLPSGSWPYTAYDCNAKKYVVPATQTTTISVMVTANNIPVGLPNYRPASNRIKICAATTCTC